MITHVYLSKPSAPNLSTGNPVRSSATISFGIPGKSASDVTEWNASFVAVVPAVTVKKTDSNSTANNMAELVFSRMENGPSSDEGYRDECDLNNFKLGMMWKTTKSLSKSTNRPECVIFRVAGSLRLHFMLTSQAWPTVSPSQSIIYIYIYMLTETIDVYHAGQEIVHQITPTICTFQ